MDRALEYDASEPGSILAGYEFFLSVIFVTYLKILDP